MIFDANLPNDHAAGYLDTYCRVIPLGVKVINGNGPSLIRTNLEATEPHRAFALFRDRQTVYSSKAGDSL